MRFYAILTIFFLTIGLARSEDKRSKESVPPPAGRALLYRSANLQDYDYPAWARADFDTRLHRHKTLSILGPPGFWTEPSLRAHYRETLRLRYHPDLFPRPPPFEDWLKEQKLIRAIALHSDSIKLETGRPNVKQEALMLHEMHLGELTFLLRQTQIAAAIRYAKLSEAWLRFEKAMYRYWGSFLAVSQGEVTDAHWRELLSYLNSLTKEGQEDERLLMKIGPEKMALLRDAQLGQRVGGKGDWRQIMVEEGEGQSSSLRREQSEPGMSSTLSQPRGELRAGLQSSTPRRWPHTPQLPSGSEGESVERLREVFTKDLHI
ncbi:uncharacterized protein UTRI_04878_B [Ustilago trichophora]|uniref:J domain-containing protein n=1 Tax=Ustilago trichophora TaxID=86804 RepID=A0A5C3EFJ8_9BASI|nr:uncharacterized protein UTRI_04878_B [Ustilago trichophora]